MNQNTTLRVCTIALLVGVASCLTMVTAPADDVIYGAVNIVAREQGGQVIKASSEIRESRKGPVSAEWRKENLIDGKRVEGEIVPANSYGWATTTAPAVREPAWVVFGFAGNRQRLIGAVRIDPRTNDPRVIGRWVKNFTVEVSVIGAEGPWQRVSNFECINVARPQRFVLPAPTPAKYVRLLINSNHGSNARVGFGEFEVFEALVGDDELTKAIEGMESELARLRRFAAARAGAEAGNIGPPNIEDSLIAAKNGGSVIYTSSVALDEDDKELEQWGSQNLIDGLIATSADDPDHNSLGWSSNRKPTEDAPEMIAFAIPGEYGAVIDSAIIDTNTRDPWGMMRGAKHVELEVSTSEVDGPWTSLGVWTLPMEPARHWLQFAPMEARYVRVKVWSNFGSDRYVEFGEFGVFRHSVDVSVIGGIADRIDRSLVELKRYREGVLTETGPGE